MSRDEVGASLTTEKKNVESGFGRIVNTIEKGGAKTNGTVERPEKGISGCTGIPEFDHAEH